MNEYLYQYFKIDDSYHITGLSYYLAQYFDVYESNNYMFGFLITSYKQMGVRFSNSIGMHFLKNQTQTVRLRETELSAFTFIC